MPDIKLEIKSIHQLGLSQQQKPLCHVWYKVGMTEDLVIVEGIKSELEVNNGLGDILLNLKLDITAAADYYFQRGNDSNAYAHFKSILVLEGLWEKLYDPLSEEQEMYAKRAKKITARTVNIGENINLLWEYINKNYPLYSEPFYATLFMYHFYVTKDEFKLGHLFADWWAKYYVGDVYGNYNRKEAAIAGSRKAISSRQKERLDSFMTEIEKIYYASPEFQNNKKIILQTAFEKTFPKGTYASGRFDEYRKKISRDEPYLSRMKLLFGEVT